MLPILPTELHTPSPVSRTTVGYNSAVWTKMIEKVAVTNNFPNMATGKRNLDMSKKRKL